MGAPMGAALLVSLALLAQQPPAPGPEFDAGFASITEKDVLVHLTEIASPELEGRDSPSEGLTRAGDYIIGRLKAAGVEPGGPNQSYRMSYSLAGIGERPFEIPVPEQCLLAMQPKGADEVTFVLEEDFVPLPHCPGEGEGPLTFFGFGITEADDKRYDDLKGKNCKGEIVMILEGEPRSKKLFEGPVITRASNVYSKAKALEERGAHGVLVVRRAPSEVPKGLDGKPVAPPALGYRYTWAPWNPDAPGVVEPYTGGDVHVGIPVLEISESAATRLLGEDVTELAGKIESTGKPVRRARENVRVSVRADFAKKPVQLDNVVGLVRGTDAKLAQEYVVLGAHYDHIGVDAWGRVGCGADDNGSGSASLVELAEAFALCRPKRSLLFAWFSAEEDGELGSLEFCKNPPVAKNSMVAMLNMDMIGCVADDEVVVLGCRENPEFEDVLKDARKLRPTQLKKVETDKGYDLWERSDHYSFHKIGIPVLFFLESGKDSDNPDYHTYRDTLAVVSVTKIARVTHLVFNTAWLIANDPQRPPPPH